VPRFWAREKEHTAAAKAFSCSISAPVQQKIQDPIYIVACRAADDQATLWTLSMSAPNVVKNQA
jgi:hypothetical protein